MTAKMTYNDKDAARLLHELRAYMNQHPTELLLCAESTPIPGLPVIGRGAEQVYRSYRSYTQTPWGPTDQVYVRYSSEWQQLPYARLYRIIEATEGVAFPELVVPELAVAVVNPITGLTAVYTGDNTGNDFAAATPVWQGLLQLPDRGRGHAALGAVRLALALAGVPCYPEKIFVEQADYPWLTHDGEVVPPATIANAEVAVPLVGYVVDPDSKELVYLSLVGHKTATRSIWGSLSTAHRRKLTLEAPQAPGNYNRVTLAVESAHNYGTHTHILDPDTGLQRLLIVDRRCTGEDEEQVYLVLPKGSTDDQKYTAFAARLGAVLPVGIPAHWGRLLYQMGLDNGLVRVCTAGGDVEIAYRLTAAGWLELLDTALKGRTLRI